jgi:apolipoprotein N-acyltransferase
VRGAALVAGALPVLAFPRANLDWLAWVALVPGLLLFRAAPDARRAVVRGWWFGAGFLLATLYWLTPDIGPGLIAIAAVFGALWTPFGYFAWALIRPSAARLAAALVVVPSAWLITEWIRSWQALGGPWDLYGATQWRHPAVLALAALGGSWLVTAALVGANVAVAGLVLVVAVARRSGGAGWGRLVAVGVLAGVALVVFAGAGPLAFALRPGPPAAGHVSVALVQPGPGGGYARSAAITARLGREDLIVWGESSVGVDLASHPALVRDLTAAARVHRAEILINEDTDAHGTAAGSAADLDKTAVLIGPSGVLGTYTKMRLVPFGEYVPFRRELGWLTAISRASRANRIRGRHLVTMRVAGVAFGPLICFESTFPDMSRDEVRRGAQMIVYQSSTSTFQRTWAPAQHASLGALRAAETGLPVAQAALTGVSAAYDAQGRRLGWLDVGGTGAVRLNLTVPPPDYRTPFDVLGEYVPWTAVGVTALGLGVALVGFRRRRPAWRPGAVDVDGAQ